MKMKPVIWAALVLAVVGVYGLMNDMTAKTKLTGTKPIIQDWLPLAAAVYFFFIE